MGHWGKKRRRAACRGYHLRVSFKRGELLKRTTPITKGGVFTWPTKGGGNMVCVCGTLKEKGEEKLIPDPTKGIPQKVDQGFNKGGKNGRALN